MKNLPKIELPVDVFAEGFPVDPDFPQLKVASDPQLMLEVFRRHLRPVSGRLCQIQECRPFRFRCRQSSSRCVLQYTLRVLEPGRECSVWPSAPVGSWRPGAGAAVLTVASEPHGTVGPARRSPAALPGNAGGGSAAGNSPGLAGL